MPRVARRFLPVLFAMLAVPATATASTVHVTTTTDVVPGSLRATIAEANPNDVIEVPAGRYKLTAGELGTNKNLTIEGAGAAKTTVDGQGASRVFHLTDATFTLRGLTVTGGHDPVIGGGILTSAAALTLDRVTVRDNRVAGTDVAPPSGSSYAGGGIYSDSPQLTLTHSSVISNHSGGGGPDGDANGGGIALRTTADGPRGLSLDHSSVIGNTTGGQGASGSGAGIDVSSDASHTNVWTLTATDSTIARNVSGGGGNGGSSFGAGVSVSSSSNNSTFNLTVDQSTISGNRASDLTSSGFGGGISFGAGGSGNTLTLTVTNSTITGNFAGGGSIYGGGVGGGLAFSPPSGMSSATLRNTTIAGNTAAAGTGVAGPSHGGGISGSVGLQNTIIAGNQASVGRNCQQHAVFSTHDLEDGDTCGLGSDSLKGTDPKLGPLRDNGGPTLTRALALDSPAVDQASPGFCPSTDQRGVPRDSARCDIGAFELTRSDLALRGSAPRKAGAGRRVTFAYRITNNGPADALAVKLTDSLPKKLRFAGASVPGGTCAGTRQIVCSVGTLASGASRTVRITAIGAHAGKVANPAAVTSGSGDAVPGNNAARPSVLLLPAVQKLTVKPASWSLGDRTTIRYTLSDAAKVRFAFAVCTKKRKHGGCAHYSKVGSLNRHGHAGKNKLHFDGSLPSGAVLSPGSYRLSASASDSKGNRSPGRTALFKLRP